MLFIAERVAELRVISSNELPPLCAIAPALDSNRAVANVIVETFIVDFSLWSVDDSNHTDPSGSVAGNQIVRIDGDTDDLAERAWRQLIHSLQLTAHPRSAAGICSHGNGWCHTASRCEGRVAPTDRAGPRQRDGD
jgi:hypothetical protein